MTANRDIWRAANVLLKEYGDEAPVMAADRQKHAELLERYVPICHRDIVPPDWASGAFPSHNISI